ncbi:hypothetical protein BKA65DRAFT_473277 [Rhexocercosporidium sp. MPI-PUGE-AT-0058]|nr:hypothetical protein BKA65DRAFT_473277 [Rhexocercosporidium sp. MPI-PUGE-AT-0058]
MTLSEAALRLLTSPLSTLTSSASSSPLERTPELMRRTSWGSSSSSSSADTADTELREWNYRRRSIGGAQDEVERKRWEGRAMRDRIEDAVWDKVESPLIRLKQKAEKRREATPCLVERGGLAAKRLAYQRGDEGDEEERRIWRWEGVSWRGEIRMIDIKVCISREESKEHFCKYWACCRTRSG